MQDLSVLCQGCSHSGSGLCPLSPVCPDGLAFLGSGVTLCESTPLMLQLAATYPVPPGPCPVCWIQVGDPETAIVGAPEVEV